MKKFNEWFNTKFGWFFTNGMKVQQLPSEQMEDSIKSIQEAFKHADGFEVEITAWALFYMKENPNLTISEAITMGYMEWIK